jgi:hypothetical protein
LARLEHDPEKMGAGFPTRQTQDVCAEVMSLVYLHMRRLEDRPPFGDFRLLPGAKRLWRKLIRKSSNTSGQRRNASWASSEDVWTIESLLAKRIAKPASVRPVTVRPAANPVTSRCSGPCGISAKKEFGAR